MRPTAAGSCDKRKVVISAQGPKDERKADEVRLQIDLAMCDYVLP